jgi:hypothetical protein
MRRLPALQQTIQASTQRYDETTKQLSLPNKLGCASLR